MILDIAGQTKDLSEKYDHYQELFSNLIQEMQTTEGDEDPDQRMHDLQSPLLPSDRQNSVESEKVVKKKTTESAILIEGDLNSKQKSRNENTGDQALQLGKTLSIKELQDQFKRAAIIENKLSPQRKAGNSLMILMSQKDQNKIFVENSPERKSHDNMLISSSDQKPYFVNDDSNVLEKVDSSQMLSVEIFNEVLIARQEKQIKAYTQRYEDNLSKVARAQNVPMSAN